jgi:hypothetical protein
MKVENIMERAALLQLVLNGDKVNRMASRLLATPPKGEKERVKWVQAREALERLIPDGYFSAAALPIVEAIRVIENGWKTRPSCVCGKPVSFFSGPPAAYATFCGASCAISSSEVQEKQKRTNLGRYGVASGFNLEKAKQKSKEARKEIQRQTGKWPGPSAEQMAKARAKGVATRSARREAGLYTAKEQEMRDAALAAIPAGWSGAEIGHQGRLLRVTHSCGAVLRRPRGALACFVCEASPKEAMQWQVQQELEPIIGKCDTNYRLPSRLQLDLLSIERKLAIEFNGLYWHSQAPPRPRQSDYHQRKYLEAKSQGLRLITIWEDQWRDKKDVILGRLKALCSGVKIGARSCLLVELDGKTATIFYEKHHLDGAARGAKLHLGLLQNGEVVQAASFSKVRYGKDRSGHELLRMATAGGIVVVGGASRLIAEGRKQLGPKLLSYASTDWGGEGYGAGGATLDGITPPGMFYYEKSGMRRWHRLSFSRGAFEKTTGLKWDSELNEAENAERAGFYQVFTGGSLRWRWS